MIVASFVLCFYCFYYGCCDALHNSDFGSSVSPGSVDNSAMYNAEEEYTFALVSFAHIGFLKIRTCCSSILWFPDNFPFSRLGSIATGHTAVAPIVPLADLAVTWDCKSLMRSIWIYRGYEDCIHLSTIMD